MSGDDAAPLSDSFRDLDPESKSPVASAAHVDSGIPIPKTKRIELFSPDEWEEFTEEWALSLKDSYVLVRRFGGSGDMGLDVAAFGSAKMFEGDWDNYQCKRYDHPLYPSNIWTEVGKIVFYTHIGRYSVPKNHFFVGSKGIGTSLTRLLLRPADLKTQCKEAWSNCCEGQITDVAPTKLEGALLEHFEAFDFSIFGSVSLAEMIEGHSTTPFHAVRFGGGLPVRPTPDAPPDAPAAAESRYIEQLYEAYSDHTGTPILQSSDLSERADLVEDFIRQRVRFYHAESLRNFARDTVPSGTFEDLKEQVFQGVVDLLNTTTGDGLNRMRSTMSQAASTSITSSALSTVTKTQDKQGICHQLANDDKLTWVDPGGERAI